MATIYISEFRIQGRDGDSHLLNLVPMPEITTQTVAIAGASAQSAAFGTQTALIRVIADAVCSIAVGSNPTATATSLRLAANSAEYFSVRSAHKLAVISNT